MRGDVALVRCARMVSAAGRGLFDLAVGPGDRLLGIRMSHAGALGVVVLTRDVPGMWRR